MLQLTITASRSKIYSLAAMQGLTTSHNRVRREMGKRDPFRTWVIDTETGFTGQGVMVAEAVRQLDVGVPAPHVEATMMERLRRQAIGGAKDLFYLYTRPREKGDKSFSWLGYNVAQTPRHPSGNHAMAARRAAAKDSRSCRGAGQKPSGCALARVKRGLTVPGGLSPVMPAISAYAHFRPSSDRASPASGTA